MLIVFIAPTTQVWNMLFDIKFTLSTFKYDLDLLYVDIPLKK